MKLGTIRKVQPKKKTVKTSLTPRPDGSFYCHLCRKYTKEFTKSGIKSNDSRCRLCLREIRLNRYKRYGHLQKLKDRLYRYLSYHGYKEHAKALSVDTVIDILQSHNVDKDSYNCVRRIKVVEDKNTKELDTSIVFY